MKQWKLVAGTLVAVVTAVACVQQALAPVEVETLARPINYIEDVKPVLDNRCVVCHACYDAPCQLKLSSAEGIDRGADRRCSCDGRSGVRRPARRRFDALAFRVLPAPLGVGFGYVSFSFSGATSTGAGSE